MCLASRSVTDPGRVGCTIIQDVEFPDTLALARHRRANRPCYDLTPGPCKCDPHFKAAKRKHNLLRTALSDLGCSKAEDGNSYFLFAGHSRRRDALNAPALEDPAQVKADTFRATCLSDQTVARLGMKTFTLWDQQTAPANAFDLQGELTLRRSPKDTLEEVFSHGLCRDMVACGHRHWIVYKIDITPLPGTYSKVQLSGARGVRACFRTRGRKGVEPHDASGDVDDIEAACETSLAGHPTHKAKPAKPAKLATGDDVEDIEDALEEFFAEVEGDDKAGDRSSDTDSSDKSTSDADEDHKDDEDDDLGRHEKGRDEEASEEEEFFHRSPRFSRVGNKLMWDRAQVGLLTSWGGSISCHCRIKGHSGCRSPASKVWPSDSILIDWVLHGLGAELDKSDHVQMGKMLSEQHRPKQQAANGCTGKLAFGRMYSGRMSMLMAQGRGDLRCSPLTPRCRLPLYNINYHITSCHIISNHIISYHIMPHHATSFHIK